MSNLIIGGLLVIGIAALIALFFVLRSNPNSAQSGPQVARAFPVTPQPDLSVLQDKQEPPVIQERTVPLAQATPVEQVLPVTDTTAHAVYDGEQPLKMRLNGQFYELANGLRTLQQQATDMEQRLGSLTKMIENIEDNPDEA